MATHQEKVAAAEAALAALGATDPAEAERFVALFDSQAGLMPKPEPAPAPAPKPDLASAALIGFNGPVDDPDLEARIKANEAETLALAKIMIERSEQAPSP